MKINKDVEIAIKALNLLKVNASVMRTSDIASQIGTTVPFLEQVMRMLKNAKIVIAKKGPGGGYTSSFTPHTAMEIALSLGYTFDILGEPNTPENFLSMSLIEAFKTTFV